MSHVPQLAAHLSFMKDGFASHSPAAAQEAQAPEVSLSTHAGPDGGGGAGLQPQDSRHCCSMNVGFASHSPAWAHDGQLSAHSGASLHSASATDGSSELAAGSAVLEPLLDHQHSTCVAKSVSRSTGIRGGRGI